jgi:hypothetical protein
MTRWRKEIWSIEPQPDNTYEVWCRESDRVTRLIASRKSLSECFELCSRHGIEESSFAETGSGKHLSNGIERVITKSRHGWRGPFR